MLPQFSNWKCWLTLPLDCLYKQCVFFWTCFPPQSLEFCQCLFYLSLITTLGIESLMGFLLLLGEEWALCDPHGGREHKGICTWILPEPAWVFPLYYLATYPENFARINHNHEHNYEPSPSRKSPKEGVALGTTFWKRPKYIEKSVIARGCECGEGLTAKGYI